MVCEDCHNKLERLVTPEVKFGSKSTLANVKVNVNMILSKKKDALDSLGVKCLICKTRVESKNKYCLTCAFTNGLCEMCGKKISETKMCKNTDVDWKDNYRKNKMSEKTKLLSNKLLVEKNIIKKEDTCLNKKRIRTEESKNESITKKKDEIRIKENSKDIEDIKAKAKEEENENDKISDNNLEDENEYDEIINI